MNAEFHIGNRQRLYERLEDNTVTLVFAGKALRKTGDEYYSFFASRNFVYLTGLDREGFILMSVTENGETHEKIFIQPKNLMVERWTGVRMSPEEVTAASGILDIDYVENFQWQFHTLMRTGKYKSIAMDLFKQEPDDQDPVSFRMAEQVRRDYPYANLMDIMPIMRDLRTIKQPCEIEGMRKSALITKAGIEAMMAGSRPGMTEYQYKALYDQALTWRGCLSPGFPSIISAGENNFVIHYYDYKGIAKDGDMILNDVSACYDNVMNDVSRGWPCNGKFTERQKLLYTCAYNTSEYLFSIIRPGMPMESVDRLAREFNFEQLKAIGLLDDFKDIRKYMWHGGAHHVGYDVHDQVYAEGPIRPGMVFCVDIGIYVPEWGIGFRLEDNCLVTEDGCENLTAAIPRSIEDIEAFMAKYDHSPLTQE